ncbi:hypothetical protein GT034_04210 [Streptomyces sp. SID2563]|nr:hypothetical protein [Streptomyces sp. SID2563]MYW07552.1 hypothetical protein [Streptomyces sp. SID2563]
MKASQMDPARWLVTLDDGAVSGAPAVDPYDRHRSVANSGRCGTTTRT